MHDFIRSRLKSFTYAFSGIKVALQTQKNTWIHLIFTVAVLALAVWLKLSVTAWAILIVTIALVWVTELINSSIETIFDLVNPDQNPLVKNGKDLGAAAVLVAAIASVIIGLLILGPALIERLKVLFTN
jgi:diacylglycerol kinase (ATP)